MRRQHGDCIQILRPDETLKVPTSVHDCQRHGLSSYRKKTIFLLSNVLAPDNGQGQIGTQRGIIHFLQHGKHGELMAALVLVERGELP